MAGSAKKASGERDSVRRVLDSIRQIVRALRLASREAEKQVGLSGAQLFVLQKLAEGGVLSVNDLAERTHTHQSSVSVVVQRLVEAGLVDRTRSERDARQAQVSVTPAGKSALKSAPSAAQDQIIEALSKFNKRDIGQLAESLDRLVEELGIDGEAAPMLFEDEAPKKNTKSKSRATNGRQRSKS
jgi:DNA-binding MarR family transcriptional regulator